MRHNPFGDRRKFHHVTCSNTETQLKYFFNVKMWPDVVEFTFQSRRCSLQRRGWRTKLESSFTWVWCAAALIAPLTLVYVISRATRSLLWNCYSVGVGFIEELIPGDPPVPEDEILGSVGLLSARGCGGIIEKYKCVWWCLNDKSMLALYCFLSIDLASAIVCYRWVPQLQGSMM